MNKNIQLNINGIKNKDVTEQSGELQKRGTTLYQDMARGNKSESFIQRKRTVQSRILELAWVDIPVISDVQVQLFYFSIQTQQQYNC